jgi:hypothetical protein
VDAAAGRAPTRWSTPSPRPRGPRLSANPGRGFRAPPLRVPAALAGPASDALSFGRAAGGEADVASGERGAKEDAETWLGPRTWLGDGRDHVRLPNALQDLQGHGSRSRGRLATRPVGTRLHESAARQGVANPVGDTTPLQTGRPCDDRGDRAGAFEPIEPRAVALLGVKTRRP